jgi:hypothetical protein
VRKKQKNSDWGPADVADFEPKLIQKKTSSVRSHGHHARVSLPVFSRSFVRDSPKEKETFSCVCARHAERLFDSFAPLATLVVVDSYPGGRFAPLVTLVVCGGVARDRSHPKGVHTRENGRRD